MSYSSFRSSPMYILSPGPREKQTQKGASNMVVIVATTGMTNVVMTGTALALNVHYSWGLC